jgi:hypothetical protein
VEYSLVACVAILAASLVAVVWRVARDAPLQREQSQAFMLGVLERYRAKSISEVAQADIMREQNQSDDTLRGALDMELGVDLGRQHEGGYSGDLAVARSLMDRAGLDPDDDGDVELWNSRMGSTN